MSKTSVIWLSRSAGVAVISFNHMIRDGCKVCGWKFISCGFAMQFLIAL